MKCDNCGSEQAIIHIRQVSDEQTVDLHLCEQCAALKGINTEEGKVELSISGLLNGLVRSGKGKKKSRQNRVCPSCGMTAELIRKRARVGCNECYTVFAREVRDIIGKMYGRVLHKGKFPRRMREYKTLLLDVEALKRRLRTALRDENYEEAARLRDRIEKLKEQAEISNG